MWLYYYTLCIFDREERGERRSMHATSCICHLIRACCIDSPLDLNGTQIYARNPRQRGAEKNVISYSSSFELLQSHTIYWTPCWITDISSHHTQKSRGTYIN